MQVFLGSDPSSVKFCICSVVFFLIATQVNGLQFNFDSCLHSLVMMVQKHKNKNSFLYIYICVCVCILIVSVCF